MGNILKYYYRGPILGNKNYTMHIGLLHRHCHLVDYKELNSSAQDRSLAEDGNSLQDKQWTSTGAGPIWFLKKKKLRFCVRLQNVRQC